MNFNNETENTGYHGTCSVLSCGYHAEGRVNPGVTELTREQKEGLKKMYGRYQLFTTLPVFRNTPWLRQEQNLFRG